MNVYSDDNDFIDYDAEEQVDSADEDDNSLPYVEDDKPKKKYIVLKESDIKKRMEDDIREVCNVLSIPRKQAIILLHYYKWTVNLVVEEWFADEGKARSSAGLLRMVEEEQVISKFFSQVRKLECKICYNYLRHDKFAAADCGHYYCKDCYSTYIKVSIDEGKPVGCLDLKCPRPDKPRCQVTVDQDMINSLSELPDSYKAKYEGFLYRSYIEKNRNIIKWCPGINCENAIELSDSNDGNVFDVICDCSWEFCWSCSEEMHSPMDCETTRKWLEKTTNESENINWILAYTKNCPRCKKPIEKNEGCMHMTCRTPGGCGHEFCWLCLGDWKNHGRNFYACNTYDQNKEKFTEEETVRERAKSMIDRYTHYYERWHGNGTSRSKARQDLRRVREEEIDKLCYKYMKTEKELKGIEESWVQIIECRRFLRWSYAYGFYIPENSKAKKDLFEYLQGQAESQLEKLHGSAERELARFLTDVEPFPEIDEFDDYCNNLNNLTRTTRTFFQNLITGLQNGLEEVGSRKKYQKT